MFVIIALGIVLLQNWDMLGERGVTPFLCLSLSISSYKGSINMLQYILGVGKF